MPRSPWLILLGAAECASYRLQVQLRLVDSVVSDKADHPRASRWEAWVKHLQQINQIVDSILVCTFIEILLGMRACTKAKVWRKASADSAHHRMRAEREWHYLGLSGVGSSNWVGGQLLFGATLRYCATWRIATVSSMRHRGKWAASQVGPAMCTTWVFKTPPLWTAAVVVLDHWFCLRDALDWHYHVVFGDIRSTQ